MHIVWEVFLLPLGVPRDNTVGHGRYFFVEAASPTDLPFRGTREKSAVASSIVAVPNSVSTITVFSVVGVKSRTP